MLIIAYTNRKLEKPKFPLSGKWINKYNQIMYNKKERKLYSHA
jgi:hypothetical protein